MFGYKLDKMEITLKETKFFITQEVFMAYFATYNKQQHFEIIFYLETILPECEIPNPTQP